MTSIDQFVWPDAQLAKHPLHCVLVCGHQLHPPLYSHVVNFPRLEIPLSGNYENEITLENEAKIVRLKPGTALFVPPNCWNLPTWRSPVQLMSLLFTKGRIGISVVTVKRVADFPLTAQKFSLPRPFAGPIPSILQAMTEVEATGEVEITLPDLVRALLACLREKVQQPADQTVKRTLLLREEVCMFLQHNYQFDVSRESVARRFGISPSYLSRIFQIQSHMTFSDYLAHVRIDRAKHLLENYDLKLTDVATRCGYHDTAYFCRVFKRLVTLTPATYRTQRTHHLNQKCSERAN